MPDTELPYWLSQDKFREVADRVQGLLSSGQEILITFDNGNLSDLEIAAPIRVERDLKAEFFILTGRLDQPNYLSPAQIQDLLSMGMQVGLHGRDHVDWRRLDTKGLDVEIKEAREQLASIIRQAINTVGIPFGAYSRREIARLKAEGFQNIYTSDGGRTSRTARIKARTSLRGDMRREDIEDILAGHEDVRTRTRRAVSTFLRRYLL